MRQKPLDTYYPWMRVYKELHINTRRKLIRRYKNGPIEFEKGIDALMGPNINPTWSPVIALRTGQMISWLYLGNQWWGRKIGRLYQFGRIYAIENDMKSSDRKYVGLWDDRRHAKDGYPIIVYNKDGNKGYIVDYNKWEILVQLEDEFLKRKPAKSFKFDDLTFEFEGDYKRFRRMFKK